MIVRVLAALFFVSLSVGFAQTLEPTVMPLDFAAMAASFLAFAKAIQFVTQYFKVRLKNAVADLPNAAIHVLTFALGIGGAFGLYRAGYPLDVTFAAIAAPFNWLAFGAAAAAVASGWYDSESLASQGSLPRVSGPQEEGSSKVQFSAIPGQQVSVSVRPAPVIKRPGEQG